MSPKDAFRRLRAAWFAEVLKPPLEHQMFDFRKRVKVAFDEQTEDLLTGGSAEIAPRDDRQIIQLDVQT